MMSSLASTALIGETELCLDSSSSSESCITLRGAIAGYIINVGKFGVWGLAEDARRLPRAHVR